MTFIVTGYFSSVFFISFLFIRSLSGLISTIAGPLFLLMLWPRVALQIRQTRYQVEFFWFLNRLILKMKGNLSFRSSYRESLEGLSQFSKTRLEKIQNYVTFRQQTFESNPGFLKFERRAVEVFCRVDTYRSHSLMHLETFRDELRIIRQFRHKSGQVSLQTRIQMAVVIVLYLLSLLFWAMQGQLNKYKTLVFISSLLMIVGLTIIHHLGRKKKWKI